MWHVRLFARSWPYGSVLHKPPVCLCPSLGYTWRFHRLCSSVNSPSIRTLNAAISKQKTTKNDSTRLYKRVSSQHYRHSNRIIPANKAKVLTIPTPRITGYNYNPTLTEPSFLSTLNLCQRRRQFDRDHPCFDPKQQRQLHHISTKFQQWRKHRQLLAARILLPTQRKSVSSNTKRTSSTRTGERIQQTLVSWTFY